MQPIVGMVTLLICAQIILCGMFWSLFDISRKKVALKIHPNKAIFLFSAFQVVGYVVWMFVREYTPPTIDYLAPVLVSLALYTAANFLFFMSVKISDISKSIPMLSFTPIFSFLIAWALLDEVPTLNHFMGAGFICFGAIYLNGMPSFKGASRGPYIMMIVALLFGAAAPFDKLAITYVNIPTHLFFLTFGVTIVLFFMLLQQKQFPIPKAQIKGSFNYLMVGSVAGIAGLGLQLYLMQSLYVGIVEASKRSAILAFALIFGALFFRESINLRKIISLFIMAIGLYFIF